MAGLASTLSLDVDVLISGSALGRHDSRRILFANIQTPGHVFAITGRWGRPSDADR
jgi:hypothetical protein